MHHFGNWTKVANYTREEVNSLNPCDFEYWNGAGLTYRQDTSRTFYVMADYVVFMVSGYIPQSTVVVERETGNVTVYQPPGQETPNDKDVTELLPFMVSEEFSDGKLCLSVLRSEAIITFLPEGYKWPCGGWEVC